MASRSRPGMWPRLPESVLGQPIPPRLRRRFVDPDWLLVELVAWIETAVARPQGPDRPPAPGPPAPGPPVPGPPDDRVERERDELVRACIELRERLPGHALDASLRETLARVGVTEVSGDGEDFHPERHRAVGRRPTNDPAMHNRVASTERPGYRDHDRLLVPPEVIVYRSDGRAA